MRQSTYDTLEAFYAGGPGTVGFTRRWSGELDFGVWWKDRAAPWPRWRVSFVRDTGELYAWRQAHVDDRPDVVVLGVIQPNDIDRIESILDGWAEQCGRNGGIQWVHSRMVAADATGALA